MRTDTAIASRADRINTTDDLAALRVSVLASFMPDGDQPCTVRNLRKLLREGLNFTWRDPLAVAAVAGELLWLLGDERLARRARKCSDHQAAMRLMADIAKAYHWKVRPT